MRQIRAATDPRSNGGSPNGDQDHSRRAFEVLADLRRNDDPASGRVDLESESRRYLELFDLAPASYVETDTDGRITMANLPASDLLHERQDHLVGSSLIDYVAPDRREDFERSLSGVRDGDEVGGWDTRLEPTSAPPLDAYVAVRRGWGEGAAVRVLRWLLHDITQRKRNEEQMGYSATRDLLTGLPSRAMFTEHLRLALARARRNRLGLAVLIVDVDGFSRINDRLGAAAGDDLLVQLSARLQQISRETDLLCRFGIDEFALLLPDVDLSETPPRGGGVPLNLEFVKGRIRAVLDVPYTVDGTVIRAPVSIGVGVYPVTAKDERTLLLSADVDLYRNQAKRELEEARID